MSEGAIFTHEKCREESALLQTKIEGAKVANDVLRLSCINLTAELVEAQSDLAKLREERDALRGKLESATKAFETMVSGFSGMFGTPWKSKEQDAYDHCSTIANETLKAIAPDSPYVLQSLKGEG